MRIFIGSSRNDEIPQKYMDDCEKLLKKLFSHDHSLVFGSSNSGLMGLSYRIAKNSNREILGICPKVYQDDLLEIDCNSEILTNTISERTDMMILNSDALLFLPGGIGTIYEMFSAIEAKRSGEFDKPIIIYNSCHFYDKIFELLELMYDEKFAFNKAKKKYIITDSIDEIIELLG